MSGSKNNIKFNYLYRDGGNYKIFGNVIFHNLENIDLERIEKEIRNSLIDQEFFDPFKWNIPILAFDEINKEIDHGWNEFERIETTNEEATDNRSILEFIQQINT